MITVRTDRLIIRCYKLQILAAKFAGSKNIASRIMISNLDNNTLAFGVLASANKVPVTIAASKANKQLNDRMITGKFSPTDLVRLSNSTLIEAIAKYVI